MTNSVNGTTVLAKIVIVNSLFCWLLFLFSFSPAFISKPVSLVQVKMIARPIYMKFGTNVSLQNASKVAVSSFDRSKKNSHNVPHNS